MPVHVVSLRPSLAAAVEASSTRTFEGPTDDLGLPRDLLPYELQSLTEDLDGIHDTDPDASLPEGERRLARRHRLRGLAVRVALVEIPGTGGESRGRVRDIALSGGLFVETRTQWPVGTRVRASSTLPTGHALALVGRVVRTTEHGLGIRLSVDHAGQAFLNVFIDLARRGTQKRGLALKLSRLQPDEVGQDADPELARRWHEVLAAFDDDAAHQRFIEKALRSGRIDFALERYRALKVARPKDTLIDTYLNQVGKILAFAALPKSPEVAGEAPRQRSLPWILLAVALAALLALWRVLAR